MTEQHMVLGQWGAAFSGLPQPRRPRVVQVIESEVARGCGGSAACRQDHRHEVCRRVLRYHSLDGVLLAEDDPLPPDQRDCE